MLDAGWQTSMIGWTREDGHVNFGQAPTVNHKLMAVMVKLKNKPDSTAPSVSGKWKLEGYDTFEGSSYSLDGEYDSEGEAKKAARARLDEIEESQQSKTSGGQSGIQDQVFIVEPGGNKRRFLG